DRETRELIALLSEQAPLQADTVFRERFAPTFADALAAERTKEKRVQLFNSPFGWTVGAGFVGVLAVIGWATYALATNDRAMNANLDRVASIVSQLWEIWGR
ncbi:MAG TPA: hypothetical protein VL069_15380, partial [Opitutus sp.]|nr:hypothetical protein [Opitutus sp.]